MAPTATCARVEDPVARRCTRLLAEFARSRDRQCFDGLAEHATPFLRRRASFENSRYGLRLEEAEVVQEALLNIYRYAHTFRPLVPHAFATWAARIVRNVVLRQSRRHSRPATVSFDDLVGLELTDRASQEPLRRLVDDEDRQILNTSFSWYLRFYFVAYLGLTELQKRVLHLVEIEDCSYRQVAGELGMRVEAVKMVVYRARRRLAGEMRRAAVGSDGWAA